MSDKKAEDNMGKNKRKDSEEQVEIAATIYSAVAERIQEAAAASVYGRGRNPRIKSIENEFLGYLIKGACAKLFSKAEGSFDKFSDLLTEALLEDKWSGKSFKDFARRFINAVSYYHDLRRNGTKREIKREKRLI